MARAATQSLFTAELIVPAIGDAFRKLDPRQLIANPVMFVTAVVATLLTMLLFVGHDGLTTGFKLQLIIWLWLTVLFGTFAEAIAEGRGKAQAASLRATKAELNAKRVRGDGGVEPVAASQLRSGDVVLVETNDLIPADGEVIEGVASVNEAAITGESAPVIREAGGDRSAVTAGTRVLSDQVRVRVAGLARDDGNDPVRPDQIPLLLSLIDQAALVLERLQLQDEMRDVAQLKERDRLRAALLSSVSHDLRTPLTAILAAAGEMRGAAPDELVDTIEGEARRLNRFVANLLDMARVEAGALRRPRNPARCLSRSPARPRRSTAVSPCPDQSARQCRALC